MHQIARIEFRNAKFPYARGLCPLATPARGPTPWTPVLVTNFTAPRGEAILDPPVLLPEKQRNLTLDIREVNLAQATDDKDGIYGLSLLTKLRVNMIPKRPQWIPNSMDLKYPISHHQLITQSPEALT